MDSLTIFILGGGDLDYCQLDIRGSILGHLGFGFYDNFHFGGGSILTIFIWDTLDLDSMTIFILGGILGHLGFGLYDNFHFGGLFWDTSRFGLYDNFHFGGILGYSVNFHFDTLDLDSMTIFILGGGSILGHLGFGLYDNFHFGGYSGTPWIWTL